MSADGQRTKRRRNIAENFNRLSRVHERYRQTTDGRTDGRGEVEEIDGHRRWDGRGSEVWSVSTPVGICPQIWSPPQYQQPYPFFYLFVPRAWFIL